MTAAPLDYAGAVAALERALSFGIRPSLEGITSLTAVLGRPQDSYAAVQVTGTNGKSSVTRIAAALLSGEGLGSAAYTSPHLESYTERMEIGGSPCSDEDFAAAVSAALDATEHASGSAGAGGPEGGPAAFTEFELLTAAALWLFRERRVEVACLEVGMGGRWDATSVVTPAVAAVTGVALDHTERLGGTVREIAEDKAHIIKEGSRVVLGPGTAQVAEVFLDRAASFGIDPVYVARAGAHSPLEEERTVRFNIVRPPAWPGGPLVLDVRTPRWAYSRLELVAPSYQAANVAVAIAAAEELLGRALHSSATRDALAGMTFPGRFELAREHPPLVLDGAHNPHAAGVLAGAIDEAWGSRPRPTCVLGVLADKDAKGMVEALAPAVGRFVCTSPPSPRALGAADLARIVATVTGWTPSIVPLEGLLNFAGSAGPEGIIVTGSLYTVGRARALLRTNGPSSA